MDDQTAEKFTEGMRTLLRLFIKSYVTFSRGNEEWVKRYRDSLRIEIGKKYIKIIGNDSALGFVVIKDFVSSDGKLFYTGDLLKAASWKTPALNFARGNLLDNQFSCVMWTGIQ